jgi:hypothetical protein
MSRYFLKGCTGLLCTLLPILALSAPTAMATGDANTASCPNEALTGFREYLADCRAYEMVTPQFKDGGQFLFVEAISADGSRVRTTSHGGYGGVGANHSYAIYESVRSGSGWATSAVVPPLSRFPAQLSVGISAHVSGSVWAARERSQSASAEDLYLREADGSMVKIGPEVPPYATEGPAAEGYAVFEKPIRTAGVSDDLSHVLFEAASIYGGLWPGDTTQPSSSFAANSLYEYVGTGNSRPMLVGVDGEGRLISECATVLGSSEGHSYSKDVYNAISGNGETVFFTAVGRAEDSECSSQRSPEFNEVYARVGQFPIDTVPLSEPRYSDCERCQTGVATPNSPPVAEASAEFQGASRDGSKAFFLTEQELFKEDTGLNLYEYDFDNPAGRKIVRVSIGSTQPEVKGVARVSEDGTHVYFVAGGVLTEGANREGNAPVPAGDNLYVFERDAAHPGGQVTFIGTLLAKDRNDWRHEDRRAVQATPDGRFLVFQSFADLTPGDTSSQQQVFEYDAAREELVRVSAGEAGYGAGSESADAHPASISIQEYLNVTEENRAAATTRLAVSADGSVVEFTGTGALTRSAVTAGEAGVASVYEYRSSGSLADGGVHLLSGGASALAGTRAMGLDPSGADAFFLTADSLLPQDGDTVFDLYDARSGGGFAAQAPAGCAGEGCQGAPGVAPSFTGAGSVSQPGGGNLVAPPAPGPVVTPTPTPTPKSLSRAQKLAVALRSCRGKPRRKRVVCEAQARRRFGVNVKRKGKG